MNQLLGTAVRGARPFATLHGMLVLVDYSNGPSFPSDHATTAGAVTAELLLVRRSLGLLPAGAAAVTGSARLRDARMQPPVLALGITARRPAGRVGPVAHSCAIRTWPPLWLR